MSVEKQEEILDMVRRQLRRSNPPGTEALYGRAARIDDGVKDLTLRQFNARYPLRIRREMAREEKAEEEERARQEEPVAAVREAGRDAVRGVLIEFAKEVETTPQGADFITLIGDGLEDYVDRVVDVLRSE